MFRTPNLENHFKPSLVGYKTNCGFWVIFHGWFLHFYKQGNDETNSVFLLFHGGLFPNPGVEEKTKSKLGKRDIPLCLIPKHPCVVLQISNDNGVCLKSVETRFGIFEIQISFSLKSMFGKVVLKPYLENIWFPYKFHTISIYITYLEICQFFQCLWGFFHIFLLQIEVNILLP